MKLKNIFIYILCVMIFGRFSNYVSACKLPNGKEMWWLETYSGANWLKTEDGKNWLNTNDGADWLQTESGLRWLENISNCENRIFEIDMHQDMDDDMLCYYYSDYFVSKVDEYGCCVIS